MRYGAMSPGVVVVGCFISRQTGAWALISGSLGGFWHANLLEDCSLIDQLGQVATRLLEAEADEDLTGLHETPTC